MRHCFRVQGRDVEHSICTVQRSLIAYKHRCNRVCNLCMTCLTANTLRTISLSVLNNTGRRSERIQSHSIEYVSDAIQALTTAVYTTGSDHEAVPQAELTYVMHYMCLSVQCLDHIQPIHIPCRIQDRFFIEISALKSPLLI